MTAPASIDVRLVAPADLVEGEGNPRRHWRDLDSLIESVKRDGVLQPLLARPQNGHLELVCGHRRRRAAITAGLAAVPVHVRELDDLQVLLMQIAENLEREDVHPLDEADAFSRLQTAHGYTAADVAAKVGRSESYVYGRLRFRTLGDRARSSFLSGDLTAAMALQLARLDDAPAQDEVLNAVEQRPTWRGPVTAAEVRREVEDVMRRLDAAPFPIDDDELHPSAGACVVCPFRTSAQHHLFDAADENDACTKPACWREKISRNFARAVEAFREKHPDTPTLSTKDALRHVRHDGRTAWDSPYRSLDDEEGYTRGGKSQYGPWSRIVSKTRRPAPAAVALSAGGVPVLLYARVALVTAAKAHGVTFRAATSTSSGPSKAAKQRLEAQRAVFAAVTAAVVSKVESLEQLTPEFWRHLVEGVIAHVVHDDRKRVLVRRGWWAKGANPQDLLFDKVKGLSVVELAALALELTFSRDEPSTWRKELGPSVREICGTLAVSVPEIAAQVKRQRAAVKKAAKKPARKKPRKKAAVKKPAKKATRTPSTAKSRAARVRKTTKKAMRK